MKYTLKDNDINVVAAIITLAKGKGLRICDVYEDDLSNWKLQFDDDITDINDSHIYGSHSGENEVNASFIFQKIIDFKSSVSLRLNDDYTAKLDYDLQLVKVGCQTFSFDIIKDLYKLIKQK